MFTLNESYETLHHSPPHLVMHALVTGHSVTPTHLVVDSQGYRQRRREALEELAKRMGERADYAFVGEALASRGILAVIADYRLYPDASYPGFLEDSAAAVAWNRTDMSIAPLKAASILPSP